MLVPFTIECKFLVFFVVSMAELFEASSAGRMAQRQLPGVAKLGRCVFGVFCISICLGMDIAGEIRPDFKFLV